MWAECSHPAGARAGVRACVRACWRAGVECARRGALSGAITPPLAATARGLGIKRTSALADKLPSAQYCARRSDFFGRRPPSAARPSSPPSPSSLSIASLSIASRPAQKSLHSSSALLTGEPQSRPLLPPPAPEAGKSPSVAEPTVHGSIESSTATAKGDEAHAIAGLPRFAAASGRFAGTET